MNNQQWRVIWHEQGEADVVEIFDRFADAWAISQPEEDPVLQWRWTVREQIEAQFLQGANSTNVAWTADMTQRVVIERV
jgi:hypothetical protein